MKTLWISLRKLIRDNAESAEIERLKGMVLKLEIERDSLRDVTVPSLERELELEKRVIGLYAARVEQEVLRVESESSRLAGRMTEGG